MGFMAFQGVVSFYQILSVCYWKLDSTLTQLYLRGVAWADSKLCPLDPAQQIVGPLIFCT